MHRRTLLTHIGVGATIGGLVGRLGSSETNTPETKQMTSGNSTGDAHPSGNESSDTDNGKPCTSEDDEPHERYVVSTSDESELPEAVNPHRLHLENATDASQEIAISITREGDSVFDQTETVPADTELEILLAEPGPYEIQAEADGTRSTIRIDRSWDDCARSKTVLTLHSGGINTQTRSVQTSCD